MSVERDDAVELGRIVRDADGEFDRIVETKYPEGIPEEVLAIREVNTNQFAFDGRRAGRRPRPAQATTTWAGEYYLRPRSAFDPGSRRTA